MNTHAGEPPPLRLGIDVSAVPQHPLGAGNYTVALATALGERHDVALTVLARRTDATRWATFAPRAAVRAVAPDTLVRRVLWGERGLGTALGTPSGIEVLHGPHYTMPRNSPVPTVVTVHDLTMVEHPEWHERSKVWFFGRALRIASQRAAAVICVSRLTAERFQERYEPRGPVVVIPHGIDHGRFSEHESQRGDDERICASLGVASPFVLHLGTIEPRKDVPSLIGAFDRLAPDHPELRLVLAGPLGWQAGSFHEALRTSRHGERIIVLGYVDDAAAPALLRRVAAVAYPSLEEGFGLPALEALACGAPLVTTEQTVMAELAGDAAILVAHHDPRALAAGLREALDGSAGATRRELGLEIAAKYTWAAAAQAHFQLFRTVAGY